jgi:hypothetical protein
VQRGHNIRGLVRGFTKARPFDAQRSCAAKRIPSRLVHDATAAETDRASQRDVFLRPEPAAGTRTTPILVDGTPDTRAQSGLPANIYFFTRQYPLGHP